MADWAALDHYLLIEIAERLPSMESYESFGGVCKSWQAAASKAHPNQTTFEGPWLMLREKDEDNEDIVYPEREFCSVSMGIKKTSKILLPKACRSYCVSYKDWLLVTSLDEIDTSLVHPLSSVEIQLPKLTTLSDYMATGFGPFIHKAVLSANPATTSDFIVTIIYGLGCRFGFWKSGDKTWTTLDFPDTMDFPFLSSLFHDIIFCNNRLYALNQHNNILTCDIHGLNPAEMVTVFANLQCTLYADVIKGYLVELSGGKFLVVHREYDNDIEKKCTSTFKVYEVNIVDGTWLEVTDLGCKALFLGYNASFFLECSEFNKCKPNCIYFSDDNEEHYLSWNDDDELIGRGGKDMGIYHLSDGSIRPFIDDIEFSKYTPPTWIGPSF